jgi:2,4-dienoyl-CoA reductase [(3E)-enoyl-CoA-producing], peroxisomal
MPVPKHEYLSEVWKDGIFGIVMLSFDQFVSNIRSANKVVFCTGGAGSICSAQVRAMVHLGANACIIGRNVEKTESTAKDMETCRPGARVIGIGAVDVRNPQSLEEAADRCVKELGGIDFVM